LDPRGTRNVSLALFALATAASWAAIASGADRDSWLGAVPVVGVTVAFFAILQAGWEQIAVVRERRLRSGRNVIARWTVDPARWRQFVVLDDGLLAARNPLPNRIARPRRVPAGGVDIVVGWRELSVGEDFHLIFAGTLRGFDVIGGPPICLQFHIHVSDPNGSDAEWHLRFPVAVDAQAEAARVRDHFLGGRYLAPPPAYTKAR